MRGGGGTGEEKSGHRVLLSMIIIDATVAVDVHACIHPLIRRKCEKWEAAWKSDNSLETLYSNRSQGRKTNLCNSCCRLQAVPPSRCPRPHTPSLRTMALDWRRFASVHVFAVHHIPLQRRNDKPKKKREGKGKARS